MALADEYALDKALAVLHSPNDGSAHLYLRPESRQALEEELTRLFTPLSKTQATKAANVGVIYEPNGFIRRAPIEYRNELQAAKMAGIRIAETAHGIGGES
jgi:hypothetical protein